MARSTTEVRLRRALPVAAALAAVACAGDPPSVVGAAIAPRLCATEPRPIVLDDGTEVYQEPQNLLRVGDELLLAGSPTYGFLPQPADRDAVVRARNAYAATYLTDPPRTVPKPIGGFLDSSTSVALGGGGWASIMQETLPDSTNRDRTLVGLWYGEHDGERWTLAESLPTPPRVEFNVLTASALVRDGDRLVWAARAMGLSEDPIFLYERVEGVWRFERLPFDMVEAVVLAHSDAWGLWLLVVGIEETASSWTKTLRLFRPESGWEMVHRVAAYDDANWEVLWPKVVMDDSGLTVAWLLSDGEHARALTRSGITESSDGVEYVLADHVENVYAVPTPGSSVAWLLDYVGPDPSPDPVARSHELRLVRIVNSQVTLLASTPSPFVGYVQVEALSEAEILVVGAQMGLARPQVPVRSLILRLSASC
jgi:hypothetical protein